MNLDSLHFILIVFVPIAVTAQSKEDDVCQSKNNRFVVWTCEKRGDCEFASAVEKKGQIVKCNSPASSVEKICCPRRFSSTKTSTKTTATTMSTTMTTPATPAKDPAQVAWEKCKEYTAPTYRNVTIGATLLGVEGKVVQELNCVGPQNLIAGGLPAARGEFPHMALIGYPTRPGVITWQCGGSLISERYILTAAHCRRSSNVDAKWVLLGELNRPRAKSKKVLAGQFEIEETIIHPDYKPPIENNDIMLFKLSKTVVFTANIRPICLFTNDSPSESQRKAVLTAGWGVTGPDDDVSTELQKVVISIIPEQRCKTAYKTAQYRDGFDSSTMVCAGDQTFTGKDTCSGDSGGPLQIEIPSLPCMSWQVGITSLGPMFCGNKKNPVPAIYTKVAKYVGWIQRIVWP